MPYVLVVLGNFLFAGSSLVYTKYARTQGILWLNMTKTGVALVGTLITLTVLQMWTQQPSFSFWPFFLSGFVGLASGDMFLIAAFARLGSARTLVLWGFQPVFVAVGSYAFFNESLTPTKILAILLLITCLLTFSFEGFKKRGRWEFAGLVFAILGVFLDAIGLFFSRYGFELNKVVLPLEGHFYRCFGAMTCFFILKIYLGASYIPKFNSLASRQKFTVVGASFFGTFLSLWLSLTAIQIGHLPSLAALSITTPLFSSMFEHVYEKKWPSLIFIFAFLQFAVGFLLLVGYE